MPYFLFLAVIFQGYLLRSPWFFIQELGLSFLPYILVFNGLVLLFLLISVFFQSDKTVLLCYVVAYSLLGYLFLNMIDYTYHDNVRLQYTDISQENKSLNIFYGNIYYQNRQTKELFTQIESYHPDLLMLVEYSKLQDRLMTKDLQEIYPYVSRRVGGEWYDGDVIFSRYPLEIIEREEDKLPFSHVRLNYNNTKIDVILVHTSAPVSKAYFTLRNQQIHELENYITETFKNNHGKRNIIVAWDFNLTPWSPYYPWLSLDLWALWLRNITNDLQSTIYLRPIAYTRCLQQFPFLCSHIDHIRTNGLTTTLKLKPIQWSDHYGFVGSIQLQYP